MMQAGKLIKVSVGVYTKAFRLLFGMAAAQSALGMLQVLIGARGGAIAAAVQLLQLSSFYFIYIPMLIVSDATLQGHPISLGLAFKRMGQVYWKSVGWGLVVAAAITGISIIGAIGFSGAMVGDTIGRVIGIVVIVTMAMVGILLYVRWSLVGPVIALEPSGSVGPLTRSAQLVKGQFWSVASAWLFLLAFCLPGAILMLLGISWQTRQIVNPLVCWLGVALSTLSAPLLITGTVAIYRDLTVSAEGAPV